jgi:hypothetical protein
LEDIGLDKKKIFILIFMAYLTIFSIDYERYRGWDELQRMWKEEVVANLKYRPIFDWRD